MSKPRLLTNDEYEAVAFAALVRCGYPQDEAVELIDGRFPMLAEDAIKEARRRGLPLEMGHVWAYLVTQTSLIDPKSMTWKRDGGPFVPEEVMFGRHSLEALIEFLSPVLPVTRPAPQVLTMAEMLAGLRSEDMAERILAGCALSTSLGAGLALQGEHREDVENTIGRDLSDLVGKAMAGEAAAVDELERIVSNHPALARKMSAK